MSIPIAGPLTSARGPSNVGPADEKRARFREVIILWVGNLRLSEAMKREELAQLEGLQRHLALSKNLIPTVIRICRLHPRADAKTPIMVVISLLCDNNDGLCRLSVKRMAELFARTERSIRETIDQLEKDGLLFVNRANGLPNSYWPAVVPVLAEANAAVTWFVDALSDKPKAWGRPATHYPENPGTSVPAFSENPGTSVPKPRIERAQTPEQLTHSISLKEITTDICRTRCDQAQAVITAPRSRGAKRRTELSEGWKPTPEMVTWVKAYYVATDQHVAIEAEKFQAHHIGRGNAMADWGAAWQTWWLNGFHKIPRRMGAAPAMAVVANAGQEREFAEAFERARLADEEAARCQR